MDEFKVYRHRSGAPVAGTFTHSVALDVAKNYARRTGEMYCVRRAPPAPAIVDPPYSWNPVQDSTPRCTPPARVMVACRTPKRNDMMVVCSCGGVKPLGQVCGRTFFGMRLEGLI